MSEFIWELPPYVVTPSVSVEQTGEAIDHEQGAIDRLAQQFKGKPKIEAFLRVLTGPMQTLEQAFVDIIVKRQIDVAVGDQLAQLAKLVGQPILDGLSDTDLRRYVKARIFANKSSGTGRELIKIGRLVLDDADVYIHVTSVGPAVARIQLENAVVDWDVATILERDFYARAVGVGIRIVLTWWPRLPPDLFRYAAFTGPTDGKGYANFANTDGGHLASARDNAGENQ